MANDPLDFVRIEETIAAHMLTSFEEMIGDTVTIIEHKCITGDFSGAYAMINSLDLTGLINSKRIEFEKQAISAALFGASEVVPLKETDMVKTLNIPQEVFNAVDQLVVMMENHVAEMIRDDLRATVRNYELDAKDELMAVSKSDLGVLYEKWNETRNQFAPELRRYLDRREQAELRGDPFLMGVGSFRDWSPSPQQLQIGESLRIPTPPLDTGVDSLQRKTFLYSHGGIGVPPQNAGEVIVGSQFSPTSLQIDNSTNRSSPSALQTLQKDAPPYQEDDASNPKQISEEDDEFDDTTGWSRAVANPPMDSVPKAKRKTQKASVQKDDLTEGDLAATGGLLEPEQVGAKRRKRKKFIRAVKDALNANTLYVHRPLLNTSSQALIAWAKDNGFTSTLDPDDMHVTICYSRTPVIGAQPDLSPLTVQGGGREIEQFGNATVLHFTSPELADRNFLLSLLGATSDFDAYRSHVTISYDGAPDDATQLEPFMGDLEFGPEVHKPLKENWSDDRVEAAIKADAAQTALAMQMNAATLGTGKKLFDIGANITTSRLIAFGFLSQAAQAGITTYQVNEILDAKTCPVCVFMHGKTFTVPQEYGKVLQTLGTSDPKQLKSLAPWPDQSKAGLMSLYAMTPAEMQSAGYGSPPYHPHCRGYLSVVGSVTEAIPTGTLADKVQEIIDGLQPDKDDGLVPLGEAIQESSDGEDEEEAERDAKEVSEFPSGLEDMIDPFDDSSNEEFIGTEDFAGMAQDGDADAEQAFQNAAKMVHDDKAYSRIQALLEAKDYAGAAQALEDQGIDLNDFYEASEALPVAEESVNEAKPDDQEKLSKDKLDFYENSQIEGSNADKQLSALITPLDSADFVNATVYRSLQQWENLDAILSKNGIDVGDLPDSVDDEPFDPLAKADVSNEPRDASGKWVKGATVVYEGENIRSPMAVYLTPHAAESVSDALNETSDGDLNAEVHDTMIPSDSKVGDEVYVNYSPKKGPTTAKVYRNAKEASVAQNAAIEENWKKYGPLLSPSEDMTKEEWDKGWKAWAYDHPDDPDGDEASNDNTEEGDENYGNENVDAYIRMANGYASDEKKPYPGPLRAQDYFDEMDQDEHKIFSAKTKIRKFDPDEPRNSSGEWTNGGGSLPDGGDIPGTVNRANMSMLDAHRAIVKVCNKMGYSRDKIEISRDQHKFTLNGKTYFAAGTASVAEERTALTPIKIYFNHVTPADIEGTTAHEIEHMRFQHVLNAYDDERIKIDKIHDSIKARGGDPYVELRDHRNDLTPAYAGQFPVFEAMKNAYSRVDQDVFARSDGVSEYSKEYWDGWHNGKIDTRLAMHETLAEMARIKYETGSLPKEYLGSGPTMNKTTTKAYMSKGKKAWKALFDVVEKYGNA